MQNKENVNIVLGAGVSAVVFGNGWKNQSRTTGKKSNHQEDRERMALDARQRGKGSKKVRKT